MGFILVGIGEILWDLLPAGKQLGGAPANFAYHAHSLGQTGIAVSRVGRGDLGREIVARLDALGLGAEFITLDEHRPTGTVSVRLDAAGVPDFTIYTDVAWDALTGTPEILALAPRVDAVCFGSLAQRSLVSRQAVQSFLRTCPGDAFTTVLAVGMLPMLVYKANTKWRPFQAVSQHPCVFQYGGVGHRCYSFGV